MRKKVLAFAVAAVLSINAAGAASLVVDVAQVQADVPPMIVDGRTLVPVRALFESLGATVDWDDATQTVTAAKEGTVISMQIGSTAASVNGAAQVLDVPAQTIEGRTMVPARFAAESLGARVLWDNSTQSAYIITPEHKSLVVEYLDVGQADSILLSSNGEYMLIDAGNNEDGDDVVEYLKNAGVRTLKYVVGTHPHEDHIGGMDDVINAFDVQNVLLADATSNTQTYSDVLTALENKSLTAVVPEVGATFPLGDANVTVLAAQPAEDLNNTSIVLRATYQNTSFLFMGDAEAEVEEAILQSGADIQSNVLKVGHHGSDTSTTSSFLSAVSPDAAVICCGAGNSYGHPSQATLDKLAGIPVWRTDLNGTIYAMTDGETCRITANKSVSAAPTKQPDALTESPVPSAPETAAPSAPSVSTPSGPETVPSNPATETHANVYVTKTGKRYHYDSHCNGGTYYPSTLADALARGLTPCNKCVK